MRTYYRIHPALNGTSQREIMFAKRHFCMQRRKSPIDDPVNLARNVDIFFSDVECCTTAWFQDADTLDIICGVIRL